MRNYLAVLMLMFITVAFANEKQVQLDDNNVSIEQVMVKPLVAVNVESFQLNEVDTSTIDFVVKHRAKSIESFDTFERMTTDENLYKRMTTDKNISKESLAIAIIKRHWIRTI